MNFEDDPRVKLLADKYGLDHQLGKAIEECEELEGAIIRHRLETTTDSKWAVVCEAADVIFVIRQILYKLDVRPKTIDAIIGYKYERQLARIHDKEDGDENNVA